MKTSSIRRFLLINLLLSELLTTVLGIIAILYFGHRETQVNMDNKLLLAAFTLQSFMREQETPEKLGEAQNDLIRLNSMFFSPADYTEEYGDYRSLHFHVWDSDNNLILGSHDIIPDYFSNPPLGFSQAIFNHQLWRAFTTIDPISNIKIVLVQQRGFYNILPEHLLREIIFIMFLSYPLLGLFMWIILTYGLKVLQEVSAQVQQQAPEHLSHIDPSHLPKEIKPIAKEWNKLSDRLRLAFEREKRFAADAAHELKTPLAALKTHTQLALNAKNENELINALHKIIAGVNRSAHVVQQLLTLSRITPGSANDPPTPVDIAHQAKEVISELFPQALEKNSEIELIAPEKALIVEGYDTAIAILLRNLIDNALRYSPENSLVQVIVEESPHKRAVLLKVIDNGPGIPENLRGRVFERFFRVIGNTSSGSGLGLGIVQQIVDLHHGTISLETPVSGHGLQIVVTFPKKQKNAYPNI